MLRIPTCKARVARPIESITSGSFVTISHRARRHLRERFHDQRHYTFKFYALKYFISPSSVAWFRTLIKRDIQVEQAEGARRRCANVNYYIWYCLTLKPYVIGYCRWFP